MDDGTGKPTLTVIAGPNGAGKSTFVRAATAAGYDLGPFVNADDIAAGLPDGTENREIVAGRLAVAQSRGHLAARRSFSQETTLTGSYAARLMAEAKEAGYDVCLVFIGVESFAVSSDRVAVRVARGGHDIPKEDQARRFARSLANLAAAARIADTTVILDNTRIDRPGVVVARIEHGIVRAVAPELPRWARRAIESLTFRPAPLPAGRGSVVAYITESAERAPGAGPPHSGQGSSSEE